MRFFFFIIIQLTLSILVNFKVLKVSSLFIYRWSYFECFKSNLDWVERMAGKVHCCSNVEGGLEETWLVQPPVQVAAVVAVVAVVVAVVDVLVVSAVEVVVAGAGPEEEASANSIY